MKLLYKVSRDGDSGESFYKHCDNIADTLELVE